MTKFNPKKNQQDRRERPTRTTVLPKATYDKKGKLRYPPNPSGSNRAHRRLLKARERLLPSFSKNQKKLMTEQIHKNQHREAVKKKILKANKKKKYVNNPTTK